MRAAAARLEPLLASAGVAPYAARLAHSPVLTAVVDHLKPQVGGSGGSSGGSESGAGGGDNGGGSTDVVVAGGGGRSAAVLTCAHG